MKKWEDLPSCMQTPEVRPYYNIVKKKWISRFFKRCFDIFVSLIFLIILSPLFVVLSILVACSSKGPIFFTQDRITIYCKHFKILKFRTMVVDAEKKGLQITGNNDPRITKIGKFLRKTRLDEIPQLFNVLLGQMAFVGPRPEVPHYVNQYRPEWYATLLVKAGVTCEASIKFKDEDQILKGSQNPDFDYVSKVLPSKLAFDRVYIKRFNLFYDMDLMWKTFFSLV
jgi:lipopolysaccharide/colanic/teichoic acid biosynthesis glycosyltransferase